MISALAITANDENANDDYADGEQGRDAADQPLCRRTQTLIELDAKLGIQILNESHRL
jgi:hypothetical protein